MESLIIKSCEVDHMGGLDGSLMAVTIDNERWSFDYVDWEEKSANMIAGILQRHGCIDPAKWEKMPDRRIAERERRECNRNR